MTIDKTAALAACDEIDRLSENATPGQWQVCAETMKLSDLGRTRGIGEGMVERTIHTQWNHPQLGSPAPVVTTQSGPYYTPGVHIFIREDDAHLIAAYRTLAPTVAAAHRAMQHKHEALRTAVIAYITQYSLRHLRDCPEDDTCACPLVQAIEAALKERP